ncbi:unnamed protein product [Peniophora sp. CBMAI 1063]|nr:unnamed protein product [Peniophora sp. CBMAI 1063]
MDEHGPLIVLPRSPRPLVIELTEQLLQDAESTVTSGGGSLHLLAQLDADMEHLAKVAFQLRRTRNACTPLLRLPRELIEDIIMEIVASGWQPFGERAGPRHKHKLGWILLSHICHSLRAITLGFAKLWADHAFCVPRPAGCIEVLSRAQDVPLSINITDVGPDSRLHIPSAVLDLMAERLESARIVDICEKQPYPIHSNGLWPLKPSDLAARTFPHMETLSVHIWRPRVHQHIEPLVYTYAPMITPNLKSLHLNRAYVPFSPKTLTSLSLTASTTRPQRESADDVWIMPPEYFLDMLRNSNCLRDLTLENVVPDLSSTTTPKISIPTLETLTIRDTPQRTFLLLDILEQPPGLVRHIDLNGRLPDDPVHIFTRFSDVGPSIAAAEFYSGSSYLNFQFYERSTGGDGARQSGTEKYRLRLAISMFSLSGGSEPVRLTKLIYRCALEIGLESVHDLRIKTDYEHIPGQWARMFEPFREARNLHVNVTSDILRRQMVPLASARDTARDHNALIDALLHQLSSAVQPLPELREISLRNLCFNEEFTPDSLVSAIRQRRGLGLLSVDRVSFASRAYGSLVLPSQERDHLLDTLRRYVARVEGFRVVE